MSNPIEAFTEAAISYINEARISADVPELNLIFESAVNFAYISEVTLTEEIQEERADASVDFFLSALQKILLADEDADEQTISDCKTFLNSAATHIFISLDIYGENATAKFSIVNKYLELDPVGPIIGGDIVLQGSSNISNFGPVLCKVEFLRDNEEDFTEVCKILPWEMMITPPEKDEDPQTFAIPVSIGSKYKSGTLRFSIFIDDLSKIPYASRDEDFDINGDFICAVEYTTRTADEGVYVDNPNKQRDKVVTGIRVLNNPKAKHGSSAATSTAKGGLSNLVIGEKGTSENALSTWPYHIHTTMGSASGEGLEDIIWIRTAKALGSLPEIPEGYVVYEDADFSPSNQEVAVVLAVKIGRNPLYSDVVMAVSDGKSKAEADRKIQQYLLEYGGGEYRPVPAEVASELGCAGGILLMPKGMQKKSLATRSDASSEIYRRAKRELEDEDDLSHMTFNSDDNSTGYEDMHFANEQDAINALTKRLAEVEVERSKAKTAHTDIQKKVAGLLVRLGRDGGTRMADASGADADIGAENGTEKEKHFQDTLQAIQEGRTKLQRQQSEFDQLALDLQTRLDDKEFKASEISESFNEFKAEILSRSENSRTGQGVSKKSITAFEDAEKRKDEDLEKVRLRNIQLRTHLKKLEKTLRAREQLAEGLHMIDFEQLKIENQTLNEKIEERNEELSKLKRKKTVTVQVLTHIREKLRFMERSNEVLRRELEEFDQSVAYSRSLLNTHKHEKDSVRGDNLELKRRQGFATNDMLTTDYERRKTAMDNVQAAVRELQERHFLLTKTTLGRSRGATGATSMDFSLPMINSKVL